MQALCRVVTTMIVLFALSVPSLAERPRPLGWALDAMRAGNWETADLLAARDGATAEDIIEWHRLRAGLGTYSDVIAFLKRRPDWPGETLLRRRSEPVVINQNDAAIMEFFAQTPAQSPQGILAHAEALTRAGKKEQSETILVEAWRSLVMTRSDQERFLAEHAKLLKPHHEARLDAMLWKRNSSASSNMFTLVPKGHVALAKARLGLQVLAGNVDTLIANVPKALADDPGLAHDRFEWRIRKGRWDDAKELLRARSQSLEQLGKQDAWANRRRALARDEMRDGSAAVAYELASNHFLTEGSAFADLEWLSGYIALRKLGDPQTALRHFKNHRAAIRSPISRGRAGYWIGRAHEALGDAEAADMAYADGAQFQTSFYGILAAERGGFPVDPDLDGAEIFPDWRTSDLAKRDLFEAGMLLQASGELNLAERFWTHLAESLNRAEASQLGQAAIDVGQPHLAVMIAKRVAQRGITLYASYFPLHPLIHADLPMAPEMSLAIARRESEFDPSVKSGVGARGLMQIMPGTGREVAKRLNHAGIHTTERLIEDPEYNAMLGATYLFQLAQRFDGNVVLVSAGYNAGPSRPQSWMKLFGDPRDGGDDFDVVDWIEHIPFRETRNYVMRVAESLPIYRAQLRGDPLPIPFAEELAGSSLLSFAPQGE